MIYFLIASIVLAIILAIVFLRERLLRLRVQTECALLRQEKDQQDKFMTDARETLMLQFQAAASQALQQNNRQFIDLASTVFSKHSELNQMDLKKREQSIESMVKPLADNLQNYQDQLQRLGLDYHKSLGGIELELKKVIETNIKVTEQTAALKNALKRPHVRGRWGEIQLRNCVELSGMSEFCDFEMQFVTDGESESDRLIPDMVVKMPGSRVIIVDAKTPIDAFLSSLEASEDKIRQVELARHGLQVKEHIKKLSSKAYNQFVKGSADFTVLFLPNESFLYAALETQSDLMEFALQKKILIATPPTFVGLLKVVRYGWNEERLARNAEDISEAGKELHKRLCDFIDSFVSIGQALDKAKNQYDQGLSRLQSRVLVQARRMETLGAKSHKEIAIEESALIESQVKEVHLPSAT